MAKILVSLAMAGIGWLAYRWLSAQAMREAKKVYREATEKAERETADPAVITMRKDPESGAYVEDSDPKKK